MFLLAMFNHSNSAVKRAADSYLPQMTDRCNARLWLGSLSCAAMVICLFGMEETLMICLHSHSPSFPFLFWSGRVIAASLDLLQMLWTVQNAPEASKCVLCLPGFGERHVNLSYCCWDTKGNVLTRMSLGAGSSSVLTLAAALRKCGCRTSHMRLFSRTLWSFGECFGSLGGGFFSTSGPNDELFVSLAALEFKACFCSPAAHAFWRSLRGGARIFCKRPSSMPVRTRKARARACVCVCMYVCVVWCVVCVVCGVWCVWCGVWCMYARLTLVTACYFTDACRPDRVCPPAGLCLAPVAAQVAPRARRHGAGS
jgi:hypothetical protein